MKIRPAIPADAAAVAAIYSHYVLHTTVTFATEAPAAADYAARMADDRCPFLVATEEDRVTGFIYAAAFRTKEAYRWDVELTVYLAPECVGRGAGTALMERCLQLLTAQGYLNAYSCITLPNEESLRLHRRFGFRELGLFERTGYKLGAWHDVVWMGLELGEKRNPPEEPKRLRELDAAT